LNDFLLQEKKRSAEKGQVESEDLRKVCESMIPDLAWSRRGLEAVIQEEEVQCRKGLNGIKGLKR
jgi:hypothetical protein